MRHVVPLVAALLAAPALAQSIAIKPYGEIALHPERDAPAQAVALNESRIAAEIAARIEAIPVEVGQTVAKGAVIVRLDCRDNRLALERAKAAKAAAQARLELAEQQFVRARELEAKGFFSKEALAARGTEASVLRAEVEQARAQERTAAHAVDKCVVHAPFRAIVRERLGQVGELAAPGTPLVALADAGRIEVAAQVQPKDVASLERAASIRFLAQGPAREVKLVRISPALDPQARTREARLAFLKDKAPPGASGRIAWRSPEPHVPADLVVRRAGRLGVFVADAGVARFRPIADAQEGRPAALDLPPATPLVVAGHRALEDGQKLGTDPNFLNRQ